MSTVFDPTVWADALPSVSFDGQPPISFTGTITGQRTRQRTDFASKQPLFYADGNPQMQVVLTLADANGQEYNLFVKMPGNMHRAIRDAIKSIGAKGLRLGDLLTVTYTGNDAPEGGKQGAKQYTAFLDAGGGTVPDDPFADS